MKIVMAVIKPFKLDEVRDALTKIGVQGLTGRQDLRLRPRSRGAHPHRRDRCRRALEHDPEKWQPDSRKDHAPRK
jgi:nitrogen regulatory protein PII